MKLFIAHLYPDFLNIYGDRGNISAFVKRCEWRNIETEVHEISIGDKIDENLYDFYFIGGGQDEQQIMIADELQKQKDVLKKAVEQDAVFLTICGGYQLLGEYYETADGKKIPGINVLDVYTVAGNKRFIGNVTAKTDFLDGKFSQMLVGFENHSGCTYLGKGVRPLGVVKIGNGNNGTDKTEGAVYKNVHGTYLHGSLLPKNPHFTDYLIELAIKRKDKNYELLPLDDSIEQKAHKKVINKKY